MIDLMQLPASEAERLAYAEGFTGTAELFRRLADAEARAESAENALYDLREVCEELSIEIDQVLEDEYFDAEHVDTRELERLQAQMDGLLA